MNYPQAGKDQNIALGEQYKLDMAVIDSAMAV